MTTLKISEPREYPITRFWYGKGAQYSSIEELIEKDKNYFLWCVGRFQDVTPAQAEHYFRWWGEYLPDEVISSEEIVPYTYKVTDKEEFYMQLCEEYSNYRKDLMCS